MSLILIVSIIIRLTAMGFSIVLLRRSRDWRMGFLTVMLGLMALRQLFPLLMEKESWTVSLTAQITELPGLIVSVMAFLTIFFLERIITERKQTKRELQERRDAKTRLAAIIEEQSELQAWVNTFDTFVGKLDPHGVMLFCNTAPIKAGGLTKDDVLGKYFPDTMWWSHAEIERIRIVECIARARTGLPSRIETNIRSADGTPVPIIFNCQPVMDDDGKIKYITAEGKTIIDETRLRTELQEANRLKSIFLASMSHELRTPLNSIIGFTSINLQGMAGELNDEQKKQLTMVKNSANHLLNLINDLLDVSRIEAGKVKLSLEEFKLDDVVREVIEMISSAANAKDLKLFTEIPEDVTLFSDRRRLKQVLMNLVNNAVKFTEQGSVKITARIFENEKSEVCVTDTGKGIKKEDINKLFLPFQQIDMSLAKEHEGTGLGLYLVKKLLALLGGNIWANSEYGGGSEFTFTLPLKYGEVN